VRTLFDQIALVENDQAVSLMQSREAVRDGDGGPVGDKAIERLLNETFGLRIDGTRRLVEYEHRRVIEYRPGDADSLAFPTRKGMTSLPHDSIVSVGEFGDEVVRVGGPRASYYLIQRSLRIPVGNVLGDRSVEQERVLQDHSDLLAERFSMTS